MPTSVSIKFGPNSLDLYTHSMYIFNMKFDWNSYKNELLKAEREISFEQIIFHLSQGDIWMVANHPNVQKYPNQRIYFVIVDEYIYLVPHVVEEDHIFLKTIIPSRKATKEYLKEKEGLS